MATTGEQKRRKIVQENCKSQNRQEKQSIPSIHSFDEIQLPPLPFLSKMFNFRKSSECKAYSARANREMVVTTQASTEFFHECVVYREIEP